VLFVKLNSRFIKASWTIAGHLLDGQRKVRTLSAVEAEKGSG